MTQKTKAFTLSHLPGAIIIATIIVSLIVGFVLGCLSYAPSSLTAKTARILEHSGMRSVSIRRVIIRPLRGITIEEMRFGIERPGGALISMDIPKTVVTFNPILLLVNFRDVVTIISGQTEKNRSRFVAACDNALRTIMKKAAFSRAHCRVTHAGNETLALNRIRGTLRAAAELPLTIHGNIHADEMTMGKKLVIGPLKSDFTVTGNQIRAGKIRADTYGGTMRGSGHYNTKRELLVHGELTFTDIDLASYYMTATGRTNELGGKANLSLAFDSCALNPDSLTGSGIIKLSDVTARNTPLQKNLVVLLMIPELGTVRLNSLSSEFIIANAQIVTTEISGKGEPLSFVSNGWIHFGNYFYQKFTGTLSKDFVKGLPPIIANSLVANNDGSRSFQCTIKGGFSNPVITLDKEIIERAVKNAFQSFSESIRKMLK